MSSDISVSFIARKRNIFLTVARYHFSYETKTFLKTATLFNHMDVELDYNICHQLEKCTHVCSPIIYICIQN